jgi:hypothetical protein
MNSRRLMGFMSLAENHPATSLLRFPSESYAPHCSKTDRLMSRLGSKREAAPSERIPLGADIGRRDPPRKKNWRALTFTFTAPCQALSQGRRSQTTT